MWLLLTAVALVSTALLVVYARMYQLYDSRNSPMWVVRVFYLSYAGNQFVKRASLIVAAGYGILAAGYALFALQLFYVLAKRRLAAKTSAGTFTRQLTASRAISKAVENMSWWAWMRRHIAALRFLFSVRGPYFDLRMLLDDIFELASQSVAAYASSRAISSVKLNLAYGMIIFVTGVNPFVFRVVYKKSLVKQRMAGLVTDLVLDFLWGTLLPLWMAVPAMQVALSTSVVDNFDGITSLTRELERVLILSWKNYVLSVISFAAMLFNLVEIQSILREVRSSRAGFTSAQAARGVAVLELPCSITPPRHGILYRAVHFLLPVYGLAVFITSIAATHWYRPSPTTDVFACIHRVYPWFERDESCAGRRINCTSAGITGTAEELQAVFDSFNSRVLTDLLVVDCVELTLPYRFRRLSHLQSIVVKNSFIQQWGNEASISDFPTLHTVNLHLVTFGEMPMGLVAKPLAPELEYIHFLAVANATQLLDAVGSNWATLRFFDCIACELTEFHPAIKTMHQLSMLVLSYNSLRSIPDDWTTDPHSMRLDAIWLEYNLELTTIADSLWRQTATCAMFSIEHTGVSSVPLWLPDVANEDLQISAANTPLCVHPELFPTQVQSKILCKGV